MRHMISPLDLEWDELLVYHQLYLRSDFSTGITKYTDRQIENSLKGAKIGRKRIRRILSQFIDDGLFIEIAKGIKGNNSKPAIGKLVKIKDILGTLNEPNTNLKGTLEIVENTKYKDNKEPNTNLKGTLGDPLIKEKGIKNNIYSDKASKKEVMYKDIFDYWVKHSVLKQHRNLTENMRKAINKALKTYKQEDVKMAIDNYSKVLESDFYYSHRFTLENFFKQSNGAKQFLEGDKDEEEFTKYDEYLEYKLKEQSKEQQTQSISGIEEYKY